MMAPHHLVTANQALLTYCPSAEKPWLQAGWQSLPQSPQQGSPLPLFQGDLSQISSLRGPLKDPFVRTGSGMNELLIPWQPRHSGDFRRRNREEKKERRRVGEEPIWGKSMSCEVCYKLQN